MLRYSRLWFNFSKIFTLADPTVHCFLQFPTLRHMSSYSGDRHLNCYPLRVRVRQISGLYEGLDCPSDWFVGVAKEGATPTNQ